MFKTEAILLHVQKIRDHQTRIILFTQEYGRISSWDQSIKNHYSAGDLVMMTIERKNSMNLIRSSEIKKSIPFHTWGYKKIYSYLQILSVLYRLLPESVPLNHIYEDYRAMILSPAIDTLRTHQSRFFVLRILKKLGYLGENGFDSPLLQYMYHHITEISITELLNAREITQENMKKIDDIILRTLYQIDQV